MIACTIMARQSPAVAKKPLKNGGVVHGIVTMQGSTNPAAVATYPITVPTIGDRTNGMIMGKLNTIGKPKITGSLILKILGPKASFDKSL